ncbi:FluC/FEX family fluoride channel [Lacticaseibacillus daqingensis]|uniref:FluC/FEX family fluoride channel n=1 Tax=Lacticaseibacillus daqingensis TaxID=2486014 RepID=UPI000F7B62A7|nr:CrcB family protein [Lacticaseibacillus daqingensis]
MVSWVALGAGVGAVGRYLVTRLGQRWWPTLPLATVAVNLIGAFLAGLLMGLPQGAARAFGLTGVCGGLTTFSTMMVDTLILRERSRWAAWLYVLGTTALGLLAVVAGAWVAACWRG